MKIDNPYAPPTADLSLTATEQTVVPKPRSVWALQIVGGLAAAIFTFGLARLCYFAFLGQKVGAYGMPIAKHMALQACIVVILYLMLWQLSRRSKTGRNLGLGLIALIATALAVQLFATPAASSAEASGALFAAGLLMWPLFYWAHALVFSEKARHYFSDHRHMPEH